MESASVDSLRLCGVTYSLIRSAKVLAKFLPSSFSARYLNTHAVVPINEKGQLHTSDADCLQSWSQSGAACESDVSQIGL